MQEYRVFGPPGTGKTTYLRHQVQRAVESYPAEQILVTSLTRAAATELLTRHLPIPRQNVATLHALCYRLLGKPPLAELHLQEWNTQHPPYKLIPSQESVDDVCDAPHEHHAAETVGARLFQQLQCLRMQMIPQSRWPWAVQVFADAWERWKREQGYLDFTDLLDQALRNFPTFPKPIQVLFGDEAQDWSRLEWTLFRQWATGCRYAIIAGDDAQAIYTFKGAVPEAMLYPEVPASQVRILSQSYRLSQAVHHYAERWLSLHHGTLYPKPYAPRNDSGMVQRIAQGTLTLPERIWEAVAPYWQEGKSVMFLASCAYMLRSLLAFLRREGIPFENRYRRRMGAWNPLHRYETVRRILAYFRIDNATWGDEARLWTIGDLQAWIPLIRSDGILRRGAKQAIQALMDTDQRECTLSELRQWFTDEGLSQALSGTVSWFRQALLPSHERACQFPLTIAERHGVPMLREPIRVQVGTIHSVKGGEADIVVLFPDLSWAGWREWQAGSAGRDAVIRQMYVGMTRAREAVFLADHATPHAVQWIPISEKRDS